ncbi:aminoglycoside phosphotransferase family protein [Streptomyces sp. NPDC051940]|uniref:phosphotransferase family protein n=1 Tax=Streptomyces sp. NPDC051940 TaxID=3155675 RepID=UPI003435FB86
MTATGSAQPAPEALRWAAEATGGAPLHARRLAGGTHAATHLLTTADGSGAYVLRRFPAGDSAADREARVLPVLDGLDGFAPRLVAADPLGERTGAPSVLITRLPGRADIRPADAGAAAARLGRALARLHAVPTAALEGFRDGMTAAHSPRTNFPEPDRLRLAAQPQVLTHYDFWSGNVLWQGAELTGVIDWSGGCLAPRGFDVGWCRLDLALLHGARAADAFLAAYEDAAGRPVEDLARWDRYAVARSHRSVESWLPNYTDLGRTDLTTASLRARHTSWGHAVG